MNLGHQHLFAETALPRGGRGRFAGQASPAGGGGIAGCTRGRVGRSGARGGAALLFTLFVVFFVTLAVISALDTTTLELSAMRNSIQYDRALYLANAGVHEAAAQLEADSTWRGIITDGAYPADDTYEVVVVDGANATVTVTSQGVAGAVTRTVQAIIEL